MQKYRSEQERHAKFKADWQDWNANTGEFSNFAERKRSLLAERRDWNSCVDWARTSAGNRDDWCVNDVGKGWVHVGQSGNGCAPGFGVGVCGRTESAVNTIVNNEKSPFEPEYVPEPRQPDAPSNIEIQCCANIINTGVGDLRNISQMCQQAINTKLGLKEEETSGSTSEGIFSQVLDVKLLGISSVIWCIALCVCVIAAALGLFILL